MTAHELQLAPPYARYAPAYDGSGQVRFALLVHIYLRELLAHHPAPGRRAIDLACGTGTLAALLGEDGWAVTGVDSSHEMLEQAAAKLAGSPAADRVRLVQGDMRRLRGLVPAAAFDLATCTYDSLNYLLEEGALAEAFVAAAEVLAPGGSTWPT